jgi:hypothetical protein
MATLTTRDRRLGLHLPVEVSGSDADGRGFTEQTRSVNVSGGGICFESRHALPIGARLSVGIELPRPLRPRFGNRVTYRVRCVVCRVERGDGATPARVSARFLAELPG